VRPEHPKRKNRADNKARWHEHQKEIEEDAHALRFSEQLAMLPLLSRKFIGLALGKKGARRIQHAFNSRFNIV